MARYNILGICGALRAGSYNRLLLAEAARLLPNAALTMADLQLPLYNGDIFDAEGIPAAVQKMADQIAAADAVVIATPEYNQSFTGVLKNALDWVSVAQGAPWRDKPVALVSAASGRSGGARAQYALRLAVTPFRPRLLTGPEVMIAAAHMAFDENDQLTNALSLKTLTELMAGLGAEIDAKAETDAKNAT